MLMLFFFSSKGLSFHVFINEVVLLLLLPGTLLMLILAGAAHTFLIPPILSLLKLGKLLSGNKLKVFLVSLFFLSFLRTSFLIVGALVCVTNESTRGREGRVINKNDKR